MYILFLLFVGLVSNFVLATGEALVTPPTTPTMPTTPRRGLSESSHEMQTPPRNEETEVGPPKGLHVQRKQTKTLIVQEGAFDSLFGDPFSDNCETHTDQTPANITQQASVVRSNCRINTLQHSNKRISLAGQVHPSENNSSPLNQYTNDSVEEDNCICDGTAEESVTEVSGAAEESLTEVFGD